jgi:hypothetical protein
MMNRQDKYDVIRKKEREEEWRKRRKTGTTRINNEK